MALYGLRYTAQFRTDPLQNGTAGLLCTIRISKRDYNGVVNELRMGGTPLIIDKQAADTNDLFAPIRATTAEFNLVTDEGWQLADFFSNDDRTFKVEVIQQNPFDDFNLFTGYISPFDASEPYGQAPYPVRFTATDGLGGLKDMPFNLYPTQQPFVLTYDALNVVKTCLAWLGYLMPLAISINTVEASMITNDGNRPAYPFDLLSSFKIDTHRFLTDTGIESCYDVLSEVLKILNASVVQDHGFWKIIRKDEYATYLANNGTIPMVIFESYTSTAHYGEEQKVLRTVYKKSQAIPVLGSKISIKADKKKLTLNYEYGSLRNELINGDFRSGLSPWIVPGPTQPVGFGEAVGSGTDEDPYALRIYGTTYDNKARNDRGNYFQFIQYPARSGNSDGLTLSLTFKNYRTGMAKVSVYAIVDDKRDYYLQEDGTWAGSGDFSFYIFKRNTYRDSDGFDKPSAGEGKIEIEMNPVPGKGAYKLYVQLYRGVNLPFYDQDPTAYIEYRDVKVTKKDLAVRNLTGEIVKGEVTTTGPEVITDNRKRKADEMTVRLGDQTSAKITRTILLTAAPATYQYINVYYPRYGSLERLDGKPTEKWIPYGADVTVPANFEKIQRLCVKGRLSMMGKQAITGDLDLVVYDVAGAMVGPCDILYLQEIKNSQTLDVYSISLTYRYDVKANALKIKPLEILSKEVVGEIAAKNYWSTPDGAEPMDEAGTQPATKSKTLGAVTIGQIQEAIKRKETGIGYGFAFDPALGVPDAFGTGTVLINGRQKEILIRLFK